MYIDLNRIEFVITNACSGKCKHCSAGEHISSCGGVDADAANYHKRLFLARRAEDRQSGGSTLQDVLDIVDGYDPYKVPASQAVLNGGVAELLSYAETLGVAADISDCRSACGVCRKTMAALKEKTEAV